MFKASICTKATFDCVNDDRFDTVTDLAHTMNASILMHTAETSIDQLKTLLVEELDDEHEDDLWWDHADIEWHITRREQEYDPVILIVARYAPYDTILGVIVIDEYRGEILP